jgi:glycerophosphoryl diester phosphodiesterase
MEPRARIRRMVRDLGRLWKPFLVTDVLTKLLVFAILAPGTALAASLFLRLGGRGGVIADEEILDFALSPVGLLAILSLGSLTLAVIFLEHAVLVVAAILGTEREEVRARDAIWSAARRFPSLIRLGLAMLLRALPILLPPLLVAAGAYLWLLAEFDINFYLAVRPPEWRLALLLAGWTTFVAALFMLRLAAGWFLAIPIFLTEGTSPRTALAASRASIGGRRFQVIGWILGWVMATLLAGIFLTAVLSLVPRLVAVSELSSLPLAAALLTVLFLVTAAGNALVSFFSASALALLVVGFYEEWGEDSADGIRAFVARDSVGTPGSAPLGGFRHGKAALAAGAVALALVGGLGIAQVMDRLGSRDEALVIAHRGSSADAPENTMAAVRLALDQGADWVEIDVQEAADGRIVVIHDRDLSRVGGVGIRIGAATWPEIAPVDVGSWFAPSFSGERVPLLEDVLEASRDRAGVVIELKYYGHEQDFERRVVEIVERLEMEDQVKLMSLHLSGVRALKAMRPDWTVGLLTAVAVGDVLRLDGIDFHAVNAGLATIPFMRRAHARGIDVYIWTVNNPLSVSALTAKGADGIITDVPAAANRALAEHLELSALERLVFLLAYSLELVEVEEPSSEDEA